MSQESRQPPRIPRRVGQKPGQSAGGGSAGKPRPKASASSKGTGGNPTTKWIIRGVVGAVLVLILLLAVLDFTKKGQMTKTGDAWLNAMNDAEGKGDPLKFSALDSMIVGSPIRSDRGPGSSGGAASGNKSYTYAWNGIFRTYSIEVETVSEAGDEPTVSKINAGK